MLLAAGCAGSASGHRAVGAGAADQATPSLIPAVRQVDLPVATPTTSAPLLTVRVWWPDELYPEAEEEEGILLAQLDGFQQGMPGYTLDFRRKRTNGLGGILSTLRTAAPVASGALPDLTLMRREDMITAATEGLIFPVEDWVPATLVNGDLLPGARQLGEIDGVLYGVPYGLSTVHVVYRTTALPNPVLTFADVLSQKPRYGFPAGTAPTSWTLLLQYRTAGGRLADDSGVPVLDREPLVAVLDYYAQGVREGLFDASLMEIASVEDSWEAFISADVDLAGVDTFTYLSGKARVLNIAVAPIPTWDGAPVTALDGWLWLLTTQDPDRQERALAFLLWMMRTGPQGLLTEAVGVLPSQRQALRIWEDQPYARFAGNLIEFADVSPLTYRSSPAAFALQQSLEAVLAGSSPEEAADAAIAQLEP